MDDIANIKCQLHHLHLEKYSLNKNMIKISNIYVSINVSLLQGIYIHYTRENSQHSILYNTEYNNILVENITKKDFQTFMLELFVDVTHSLTL